MHFRRRDREAEGAPLLREYAVMSCIKGSNPFVSAKPNKNAPYGAFFMSASILLRHPLSLKNRLLGVPNLCQTKPFSSCSSCRILRTKQDKNSFSDQSTQGFSKLLTYCIKQLRQQALNQQQALLQRLLSRKALATTLERLCRLAVRRLFQQSLQGRKGLTRIQFATQ